MKTLSALLSVSLLLAGCASDQKKGSSSTPQPPDKTTGGGAGQVKLELASIEIAKSDGSVGFKIEADGTVKKGDGTVVGTITADGKWIVDGKVAATLTADGTITLPDGRKVPGTLGADGTYKTGQRTVKINDDGTLSGADPNAPALVLKGVTPGSKRAAMFFLMLALTPMRDKSTPPSSNP